MLTDPVYTAFHDQEWGVPVVDDDTKLFELLVFSQALAEHTWPTILNHRDIFRQVSISITMSTNFFPTTMHVFDTYFLTYYSRKFFENFDPSSIAKFNEKKLLTPKVNGNPLLSEQKLRAIVENAKQLLKVVN